MQKTAISNKKNNKLKFLPKELLNYIGEKNIQKIEKLTPLMQEKTIELYQNCRREGLFFDIVSGRRSFEEETEIYNLYAEKYPACQIAIPGTSEHEFGRAIDIIVDNNLANSEKYTKIGRIWQSMGYYWGGDDIEEYWHFDLSNGEIIANPQILFSWSGGKDSALALYKLVQEKIYSIECLFTTLSEEYKRVNFHAIPEELLELQAKAIGIPIYKAFISKSENIDEYAQKLESHLKNTGIDIIAYGDIYLEDLRDFRIKCLEKIGMNSVYPIWKTDTVKNINDFVNLGFKAILTCVDTNVLDKSFVGREIDEQFIKDLPENIDPCGENGEFHTFVYDGPIFKKAVDFKKGKTLQIDNFCYFEVLP